VTGSAAAKLMAVLASGLCLFAGSFLLVAGFENDDVKLLAGWIGIFFLGMSLFVGPTLWLLADLRARSETEPGDTEPGGSEADERVDAPDSQL
jgi:hypothetical protein